MRIVIDMQCLGTSSRFRGIGHYTLALVRQLLRHNRALGAPHEYVLLFSHVDTEAISSLQAEWGELLNGVALRTLHILPANAQEAYHWSGVERLNELLFEDYLQQLKPDFLLLMSLFEGRWDPVTCSIPEAGLRRYAVGVIGYDLIPLLGGDQYLGDPVTRHWYYGKLAHLQRAERILAISQSAQGEFERCLELQPGVLCTISSACDEAYHCLGEGEGDDSQLAALGVWQPYILYSGAADERKNLQRLLRAYAGLAPELRASHQLVLVGNYSDDDRVALAHRARSLGIAAQSLAFTGFVSQAKLNLLYNRCAVFVFPSLHEGFGLPVLEAMTSGAPALCSDTTSLPEVIGLKEATFDPLSVRAIRERMAAVLTDPAFRQRLVEHGLQQARRFSWQATAEATLAQMESASREFTARAATAPFDIIAAVADLAVACEVEDSTLRQVANCLAGNEASLASPGSLPRRRWRLEGPFDSSYSLALLNRETARALALIGQSVALYSTEGPGDFAPNADFLAANPDIAQLCDPQQEAWQNPEVVSRNLYPPRVHDMGGHIQLLHHYAWEESGFPTEWVAQFNQHLSGITCLSEHVRKVLIDNGVCLPLTVSGCGVDHWQRITARPLAPQPGGFRFLHVSSCFPRKGVDVLLAAWGRAFTAADNVSLVIKTFDNPHNTVRTQLASHRSLQHDYPRVELLVADLDEGELKGLYESCHALVAPSRAEGFGLPLAEAMLSGLPVITTGWGGQLSFCNEHTAWLVNYRLARADTHFELSDSLWAEPDIEHLAAQLRSVYESSPEQRLERVERGQQLLAEGFSWLTVATRLVSQSAWIEQCRASDDLQRPLRVGWVSTWNQRCGIAAFSRHLLEQNTRDQCFVLAPHCEQLTGVDEPWVQRCWQLNNCDDLLALTDAALAMKLDALVIQANFYFFDYSALCRLVARLKAAGLVVTLTLHATEPPEPCKDLSLLAEAFALLDRVIVHSPGDLNRLKTLSVLDAAVMLPLGVPALAPAPPLAEQAWPASGRRGIAAYGFALPHKGLEQLLEAFARLCQKHSDLQLLLLNAEHTDPSSAPLIAHLQERIAALGLEGSVRCEHRFLPDAESLGLLAGASAIVMPYQATAESSSAAVKMALAAGAPVLVSPLPIFDDVAPAVEQLSGTDAEAIAAGLERILAGQLQRTPEAVAQWCQAHSFPAVSRRLFGLLRSLWINRAAPG
jgi:O-antigen biosynthesis alpha-1,2-mannosyltransferase